MDESIIQQEINKYKKFKKVDGATYRKVNNFLRKRTYITAREWALARLCTDFRTSSGAEMTFIGKHLPELVPFMEEPYSPQAVNQARHSFKKKVRKASATFFYGAMCGFFTTDELDDLLFEASEVSRFLLEVEGTTLDIDEEIDIEDRITKVMRGVGEAAKTILKTRGDDSDDRVRPVPDLPVTVPEITKPRKKRSRRQLTNDATDATPHLSDQPAKTTDADTIIPPGAIERDIPDQESHDAMSINSDAPPDDSGNPVEKETSQARLPDPTPKNDHEMKPVITDSGEYQS
ncbi:MAG: DUF5806 family protein [Methanoregula sp.]|jgi:hypothetical protein